MANDNTAKKAADASTGSSTAAQRYLAQIYPYREIVHEVSNDFMKFSLSELASNQSKLLNYDRQIADVIRNLENLGRPPTDVKFNKQAVLKALKLARTELGKASYILKNSDSVKGAEGIDHLTPFHDYLLTALRYLPSSSIED